MIDRIPNAELPHVPVDPGLDHDACCDSLACRRMVSNVQSRLVGRFIADGEPIPEQVPVAHIDLRDLTYDDYIAAVKKRYKGNVVRDARRSDKAGFVCKPFARPLFIPDIAAINMSKEERQGRPMRDAYRKSVEDLGGPPTKATVLEPPACPCHYDRWWGVFRPEPGYRQGEVVTDEQLIAYIDFRRVGSLALYSLIIGHGDYLREGIMYRLHFAIMEWLCARGEATSRGVEQLMYAGFYQGGHGLQLWKKKTCFEPCLLQLERPLGDTTASVSVLGSSIWAKMRRLVAGSRTGSGE